MSNLVHCMLVLPSQHGLPSHEDKTCQNLGYGDTFPFGGSGGGSGEEGAGCFTTEAYSIICT